MQDLHFPRESFLILPGHVSREGYQGVTLVLTRSELHHTGPQRNGRKLRGE